MIRLTKAQILALHKILIDRFGGSHGLRDEGLFESAISTPYQTFGDQDIYPTVQEKAVRLCYGLIKNHPFIDGNKRIGTLTLLITLELNNINLITTNEELTKEIFLIASGEKNDQDLLIWVLENSQ